MFKEALAIGLAATASASNDATFRAILANGLAQSEDKFADQAVIPPFASLIIEAPLVDGSTTAQQREGPGFYTYEDGVLRLSYFPQSKSDVLERRYPTPIREWLEAVVYSRLTPGGSYRGTNAFGSSVNVTRYNVRTVKIAYAAKPGLSLPDVRLELTGAEAKALARAAAVRFTLAARSVVGRPKCEHLIHSARMDRPIETDELTCAFQGELEKIEFVRTDTGAVIG